MIIKENKKPLPFKGILAFSPEEIHMGLELQLEDIFFVNAVRFPGCADRVTQQRQASQREVVLDEK